MTALSEYSQGVVLANGASQSDMSRLEGMCRALPDETPDWRALRRNVRKSGFVVETPFPLKEGSTEKAFWEHYYDHYKDYIKKELWIQYARYMAQNPGPWNNPDAIGKSNFLWEDSALGILDVQYDNTGTLLHPIEDGGE